MSGSAPAVSVIIPTHNREDLIGETIQSVLDQTFTDFEILVVDNGSTDATCRVIEDIGDSRIYYYYQENTGGPAGPRNTGIKKARGQYIAFLDSDDLWLKDKLAVQVKILDSDPQVGLTYGSCTPFGDRADDFDQSVARLPCEVGMMFEKLFLSWNYIPCLTVMTRRSILERIGGFDETSALTTAEDFDLWLRIARVFKIQSVSEVIGRYRLHAENLYSGKLEILFLRNLNIATKFLNEGWVDRTLYYRKVLKQYAGVSVRSILAGDLDVAYKVARVVYHSLRTRKLICPEALAL
jgi:glycosyltransferase involved in cell wall biosynthesis